MSNDDTAFLAPVPSGREGSTTRGPEQFSPMIVEPPPGYFQRKRIEKTAAKQVRRDERQARKDGYVAWKQKYPYAKPAIAAFASYVTIGVGLITGFHLLLAVLWAVVAISAWTYTRLVANEWTEQQPTPDKLEWRLFMDEESCGVDSYLVPRVVDKFEANPLTGGPGEVIWRLRLRAKWWLYKHLIVPCLLYLLLLVALLLTSPPLSRTQLGLLMLLHLVAGLMYASIKLEYEGVFHCFTDYRAILMKIPSP